MKEKLKCPYCGSENIVRADGKGSVKKYGPNVMIEIAPEILHCKACGKDFRDVWFDDLTMDEDLLSQ